MYAHSSANIQMHENHVSGHVVGQLSVFFLKKDLDLKLQII